MAKKKSSARGKSRGKSSLSLPLAGLLRSLFRPPGLYLVLVVVVAVLIYWQWGNITTWVTAVWESTLRLFGWGLVFPTIAAVTLIVLLWARRLSSVLHYWNYWLGAISFAVAVWALLARFEGVGVLAPTGLGGNIGLSIIGYDGIYGTLRIAGLAIIGIVFFAPRASYRLVTSSFSLFARQMPRRPQPRPSRPARRVSEEKPVEPASRVIPTRPEMEREETPPPRKAAVPAPVPVPTKEELKQVAQDVWKKYGESPDLVTVDGWRLPPIDILELTEQIGSRSPEVDGMRAEFGQQADNIERARVIEEALASYGVDAKVVRINAGPTVTQFGVEPGWDRKYKQIKEKDKGGVVTVRQKEVSKTRVKVDRITSLSNDLALALAAPSIRIEAPVPGEPMIGIEVPNIVSSVVSLRGVIETSAFQKISAKSTLTLALGKGAGGEAIVANLAKMPHLLIAGATGSGKTVCLNALICSLLLYNTPNDVRFVMIDPKRVELTPFNSLPHLAAPVIVDANKALDALRWLSQEMGQRYQKLAAAGVRNIEGYNKNKHGEEKMPYLVLIIDELADLMMVGGDEVEHILCRLAQLARAIGIHLVVATQRPSVDVVTGLIKANFPTRISFAVTSQVDSRTILDSGGAEKLLGKGDMLFMPTEAAKPKRLQGCFISDVESERLVYFWGNQKREEVIQLKVQDLVPSGIVPEKSLPQADLIFEEARKLAREHERVSASFLQRRLRIGYPRAARIMDQLEEEKARLKNKEEEEEEEGEEPD